MKLKRCSQIEVSEELLDAIRSLPVKREVEHCGQRFVVPPFDIYATCPKCGCQLKIRSFSGATEVEDVFDAVFEWMNQPGAAELVRKRQEDIEKDKDE
jgi:predicted  nucleic acid-binding Zn-ribbon protein